MASAGESCLSIATASIAQFLGRAFLAAARIRLLLGFSDRYRTPIVRTLGMAWAISLNCVATGTSARMPGIGFACPSLEESGSTTMQ